MNKDQVMSILRSVLMFGGGLAVSRGWLDSETLVTIVGGAVALGGVIWSQAFHAGANKSDAIAVATGTASGAQQVAVAKVTR